MDNLHAGLKDLQLSLQTLLKKYNGLKKENEQLQKQHNELLQQLSEKEKLIESSEEKLATNSISSQYDIEEKELLQLKIDTYLKDIEKCLSMLNG